MELVPKTQGIVDSIRQTRFALKLARHGKVPVPFAASVRQAGLPPTGSSPAATGGVAVPRTAADRRPDGGPTTGGTPRPAFPAAVPSALAPPTPSHPVDAVGLGATSVVAASTPPTCTAWALALVRRPRGRWGSLWSGGRAVPLAD